LRQIATRSESAAPALDAVTKSQGSRVPSSPMCCSCDVMLRAYHHTAKIVVPSALTDGES
jgi:hypothetical protein